MTKRPLKFRLDTEWQEEPQRAVQIAALLIGIIFATANAALLKHFESDPSFYNFITIGLLTGMMFLQGVIIWYFRGEGKYYVARETL